MQLVIKYIKAEICGILYPLTDSLTLIDCVLNCKPYIPGGCEFLPVKRNEGNGIWKLEYMIEIGKYLIKFDIINIYFSKTDNINIIVNINNIGEI